MSAPVIQGWCPGAHKPMASGDGLVVRVRPPLGALTAAQARGLAQAAAEFGNGLIDLTNRANLQIRGVSDTSHAPLLEALAGLGLLDADPDAEGRRNIVVSPFRSPESDDRQTCLAGLLADGLRAPDLAPLPSKFGFVIDAGPERYLSAISGDIRIEVSGDGLILRCDGCETGRAVSDVEQAVRMALDLARWFLASGGVGPDRRGRMARHLAAGHPLPSEFSGNVEANPVAHPVVPGPGRFGLAVAAAFGQLSPADLTDLANIAGDRIRITPWRMMILPGVTEVGPLAGHAALITDAEDPVLRVKACTGAPGCPQAGVETRQLARDLARRLPQGQDLHVSGCSKGCAHPAGAAWTLVGRAGRFDLVKAGAPWDDPVARGLSPRNLPDLIDS